MRGAGWISVFALAWRQKTPLFFSAGDNKWRGESKRERERVRLTKERGRKVEERKMELEKEGKIGRTRRD